MYKRIAIRLLRNVFAVCLSTSGILCRTAQGNYVLLLLTRPMIEMD